MRRTRRRIIGMAGGTLWMIAVSTGFATLSLVWIGTLTARAVLVGVAGLAVLLLGVSIRAMSAARGIPDEMPPRTPEDQVMMRHFWRIVVAEIVGLAVVNSLCQFYSQDGLMAPLDVIVVGLHFVALARVFRTPRYAVMGWLFCAVPVATMLSVPERSQVGQAPAWFVVPSLLVALVVWLTVVANLREIFHLVRDTRMAAPSV